MYTLFPSAHQFYLLYSLLRNLCYCRSPWSRSRQVEHPVICGCYGFYVENLLLSCIVVQFSFHYVALYKSITYISSHGYDTTDRKNSQKKEKNGFSDVTNFPGKHTLISAMFAHPRFLLVTKVSSIRLPQYQPCST